MHIGMLAKIHFLPPFLWFLRIRLEDLTHRLIGLLACPA
jgi:hypothetical protein